MAEKLSALWGSFTDLFEKYVWNAVKEMNFVDVLDILLLAFALFYVYKFIRERRAAKLAIGLLFVSAALVLSIIINMRAVKFILQNFYQVGIIAIIIIFQSDLRAALEKVGTTPIRGLRSVGNGASHGETATNIEKICTAADALSSTKTGALIVIERETKLGEYLTQGVIVNADLEPMMIRNIFFNKAPLHDGAVIIRNGRIHAAGCYLPLSAADINKDLGTRHRAALGLSEMSDAVVIVVSEETGTVSVAEGGSLRRNFNFSSLKQELTRLLVPAESVTSNRGIFGRRKKTGKEGGEDEK